MKNKLELTWVGKDEEIKVEPRILIEDPLLSNTEHVSDTQNMLIHGDNLLALKALESKFAGQVKCIYIDPPYNTGSAFEHYDDNLEHSIWLGLMKQRLEILRNLLDEEGVIFVQIDDNEQAYLKVMMDEIFGRRCFLNCIAVKMSEPSGIKMSHSSKRLPKLKEYLLVYRKGQVELNEVKIPKEKWDPEYKTVMINVSKNDIEFVKQICANEDRTVEEVEKVRSILNNAQYKSTSVMYKEQNIRSEADKIRFNEENAYRIFQTVSMGGGTTSAINESRQLFCQNIFFPHITSKGRMYVIKGDYDLNKRKPRIQVLFADEYLSVNPCDLWTDIKTTGLDNEGQVNFKNSKKPEKLIERVLTLATSPGDLVLDSFLGSGTTAAVAHKMSRRWIGIEMGEHAYTHCKVRLDKVVAGEDSGGITSAVDWQGGGGYKFYELAPTLIETDSFDEAIINKDYDANMLASAVALHEGFRYSPDAEFFWKQSVGSENSYLFVTTRHIDNTYLESIQSQMAEDEYLTIACTSFSADLPSRSRRVTIKKIPEMLLNRCEFGKNDYNLNIVNPPVYDIDTEEDDD